MKVLVLDQAKGLWGAQRYLLRLAPLLRHANVHLTLGGPRQLELHSAWLDCGLDAIDLDLPIERNIRKNGRPNVAGVMGEALNVTRAARLVAQAMRAGDYDALWANGHWTHSDASIAGRLCRKPVVLHLHEEAVPGVGQWLRAGAVALSTRSVAVSRRIVSGLPRSVQDRVTVIANGVDTQAMSPAVPADEAELQRVRESFGIGVNDVMVLAATRIDPSKCIEDLAAAFDAVDDPRLCLVVAGVTSAFPAYERQVRTLAANTQRSTRIVFCGNRDDMTTMFRASDMVLHAGIVEGMPLGLLEAQSCGKPVIAYDVAGVPEAILNGVTGILVAPRDVAGLASAVETLTDDRELRTKMGAAGRAHVLRHHRIESQATANAAVLARICNATGMTDH